MLRIHVVHVRRPIQRSDSPVLSSEASKSAGSTADANRKSTTRASLNKMLCRSEQRTSSRLNRSNHRVHIPKRVAGCGRYESMKPCRQEQLSCLIDGGIAICVANTRRATKVSIVRQALTALTRTSRCLGGMRRSQTQKPCMRLIGEWAD